VRWSSLCTFATQFAQKSRAKKISRDKKHSHVAVIPRAQRRCFGFTHAQFVAFSVRLSHFCASIRSTGQSRFTHAACYRLSLLESSQERETVSRWLPLSRYSHPVLAFASILPACRSIVPVCRTFPAFNVFRIIRNTYRLYRCLFVLTGEHFVYGVICSFQMSLAKLLLCLAAQNLLSVFQTWSYCHPRYVWHMLPAMLDRTQHLRIFLAGSGCSRDNADRISVDKCVQVVLNQQPVDAQWLLEAVNRVSPFTLSREKEPEFLALFGRYASAARAGSRRR
jgi:hypothetical protein